LSQFEPGTDSEGHSEGDAAGYLGGRKSKKSRKKKLRRNKKRSNTKRRK
jgi:hypothetical protein